MEQRIKELRKKITDQKLDALLLSSSYNIGYISGFFDFSKDEREGYLLITLNKLFFFASGLNKETVEKHARKIKNSKVVDIPPRSTPGKNSLSELLKKEKIKILGIEEKNLILSEFTRMKKLNRGITFKPCSFLIEQLRVVKDASEIQQIKKACELGDKTFKYILRKIKKGITEKELAFEIEFYIKKLGADISFEPLVAFGKNSSVPHHRLTDRKLKTGDIVLLDFGVKWNNYCSDMSRTVFFGKPSEKFKKIYQTVLEAQQKAIELLHDISIYDTCSVPAKKVDSIARNYIVQQGYPSIPYSLGHGIGLEVHEKPTLSPRSKDYLEQNMVFSVEPGIYIENFGGVRLEDLVVLRDNSIELLTKAEKKLVEL